MNNDRFRPEGAKSDYPDLVVSLWQIAEDSAYEWAYAIHEGTSDDDPLIYGGETTWPHLRDAVWRAVEDAEDNRAERDTGNWWD